MTDAAWVALSLVERVGGKTLHTLMQHFHDDPQAVLKADLAALQQVPGIGPKIASSIKAINLHQVECDLARWREAGVRLITLYERDYPPRLRSLPDAPPTLFVRGQWQPFFEKSLAIVGTREPTREAYERALNLACDLSQRGYLIISGLAAGIDAAAHTGALAAQGMTLAVLGSGVCQIYPFENHSLSEAVLQQGMLVSEVHPYAQPSASHLVARNRLISGLSDGLIVIETKQDGGAMHAARFAFLQGRPVYTLDIPASGNRALASAGAVKLNPNLTNLPF